jgi:hypothetical protein
MNKGNQPEESGQKPAESVEQRDLAEGNAQRSPTDGTQCPRKVSRGLLGVREAARRDKKLQFTALLHHIDVALLRASFETLNRNATAGVDGVRWASYREGLGERLVDLHNRIHKGQYRAQPSKRARIAKEDGSERELGIAALEDKIVQQALVTVLNQIYEEDFLGFTHICSRTRSGSFTILRKTMGKRLHAKLRAIKKELRARMHASVPETGKWLRSVLQGYYRYFVVPNNLSALATLKYEVGRAWLRMLRRRSQKARKRLSWDKFKRIEEQWLPAPRIYHPWPNVRFRRHNPRQEPGAVIPHAGICAGGAS